MQSSQNRNNYQKKYRRDKIYMVWKYHNMETYFHTIIWESKTKIKQNIVDNQNKLIYVTTKHK